jgi:hypothetical protein
MEPKRRPFIPAFNEMTVTWQTCEAASDSPGKPMAVAHCLAAQVAFDDHDDTGCLEKCRIAIHGAGVTSPTCILPTASCLPLRGH